MSEEQEIYRDLREQMIRPQILANIYVNTKNQSVRNLLDAVIDLHGGEE